MAPRISSADPVETLSPDGLARDRPNVPHATPCRFGAVESAMTNLTSKDRAKLFELLANEARRAVCGEVQGEECDPVRK
jgi:hypothetical protein